MSLTSWTDLRGLRLDARALLSALGVFQRKNGETKQLCEFTLLGQSQNPRVTD